jgi:hypothetical protein
MSTSLADWDRLEQTGTVTGPKYLFIGSRLTSDTFVLRILLEGLNTQARHWGEVITIQDNGSLDGLEHEVEGFKYLHHRRVDEWSDPNIVIAFMDRLSHNRDSERLLAVAEENRRPWFVIGSANDVWGVTDQG